MGGGIRRGAVAVTLIALTACRGSTETPGSGVMGVVLAGPQCPVVRRGQECPDRPIAIDLAVRGSDGDVVARARSGADGRFRIALAPGRYAIDPIEREGRPPGAGPVEVEVRPNAYTDVTIPVDTGIR